MMLYTQPCNFVRTATRNFAHASHYIGSNLNMGSPKDMSIAVTNIYTFLGVTTYPSQEKHTFPTY